MKRKIWSVILTVCMVLGMMPAMSVPVAATAKPDVIEVTHNGSTTTYGDFADGWNDAVGDNNTSNTKVKLLADWTANTNNTYGTSFGTGIGFGDGTENGAGFILVPEGKTITLDLNGKKIDRGLTAAQANGEVICIDSSSYPKNTTFTLADSVDENPSGAGNGTTGCITGGYNSGNGGGIYLAGQFERCTIKGGCISGNKASRNGGGIYTEDTTTSGDLIITGGKITGNSAANGGGIYCTMCCSGITDCTVQGNTATTYGGGIYSGYPYIYMGGTTVVSGNAHGAYANPSTTDDATPGNGGATDNLYLTTGTVQCLTGTSVLASGAYIGVTTQNPPTAGSPVDVTSGINDDYSGYFHSDSNSYYIYNDASNQNNQIVKLGYGVIEVAHDGMNFTTYGDFAAGWNEAVGTSNNDKTKTTVRLLADWTAATDKTYGTSFGTGIGFGDGTASGAGYIRVPGYKHITLDLNGHNIDRNLTSPQGSKDANAGWVLKNTGTLIIEDESTATVEDQGKITGGYDCYSSSSAGGIFNSKDLTLQGGRITGNKAVNWGGGVRNNRTFTMTGGEISGNIANYDNNDDGGAGGVYNGDFFTMTGGKISDNNTCGGTHGGGVYNAGTVTFKVGGTAKITGNDSGATFSSGTASGGVTDNVYLPNKAVIICLTGTNALASGASIGVTTETVPIAGKPVAVTGNNSADYSRYFHSDNSGYYIYNDATVAGSQIVKLGVGAAYNIFFDANGGSVTPTSRVTGSDKKLNPLPIPTNGTNTFAGWYTAATGGTQVTADTVFSADTVVYAHWSAATYTVTYTVTYDGNGNTGGSVPDGGSYTAGTNVTVPGNTGGLEKTGYTFNGWNTKADGMGADYSADGVFSITADITLYAKWMSNPAPSNGPERIGGENRYDTAALITEKVFPDGAVKAIVATGENFPDALCAAGLAGLYGCPIVVTKKESLNDVSARLLKTLGTTSALVLGSQAAVSEKVKQEIETDIVTDGVVRIGGRNRVGTALKIARFAPFDKNGTAIVVNGWRAADALSIAPYAYRNKVPMFLTFSNGNLDQDSLSEASKYAKILIIGGTSAVSSNTEERLKAAVGTENATRLGGVNRYETSALVALACYQDYRGAAFASGKEGSFTDGLVGAALCGRNNAPLVLVNEKAVETAPLLAVMKGKGTKPNDLYVLGGTAAVSDDTVAAIIRQLE